jgi:hypothetical protein
MKTKRCLACNQEFHARPQVSRQAYCSAPNCQKERRRLWQLNKRQTDPDYLENQMRAQQSWCDSHPDYWKDYRAKHPEYADKNRIQQRKRNKKKKGEIAKMDVSDQVLSLPSGIYRLNPISDSEIAKMAMLIVEIRVISYLPGKPQKIAKR